MPSLDFELEKTQFRAYYEQNLALFEDALASFTALLTALTSRMGSMEAAKVEGRVKDKEECLRKFSRKYRPAFEERGMPYEIAPHITDLIGLRVVCFYEDEIEKIAEVVRSHFEVIEVTDRVMAIESTEDSFGYKGLHMDLKLSTERKKLPEYRSYAPLRFELQVRTIIQDSWSVLDHKIKYKKSIPNQLKRRINVLSALFELADREFRQIRDATDEALREAPDETVSALAQAGPTPPGQAPAAGGELNAFTFLKIATHFFRDFEFKAQKVDSFVQTIVDWSPGITRAEFNRLMRETVGKVKRYKPFYEERRPSEKLNPYAVIRHCLYLANPDKFGRALNGAARESFETWLAENAAPQDVPAK